eukprot:15088_1
MDVELGRKVGYTVRFDDCTSSQTQIRFLTDGCLLRECLSSRTHSNYKQSHPRYDSHVPDTMLDYDVVVLDEAHERSVHTDVLFGLMRELARKRKRFKLIITSATLDTHKFCGYFDDCPSFHIPGRCYPVEVMHSKTTQRFYVQSSVDTALRIHQSEPADGHILVFLTGQDEIEKACELLGKKVDGLIDDGVEMPDIAILPAYSALPSSEQQKIFQPAPEGCRKVVFATNIAETSLTVDGVAHVVDCGRVKQRGFCAGTGINALRVVNISRVAAKQRAGRAGRTREGTCYRLYTEHTYES